MFGFYCTLLFTLLPSIANRTDGSTNRETQMSSEIISKNQNENVLFTRFFKGRLLRLKAFIISVESTIDVIKDSQNQLAQAAVESFKASLTVCDAFDSSLYLLQ